MYKQPMFRTVYLGEATGSLYLIHPVHTSDDGIYYMYDTVGKMKGLTFGDTFRVGKRKYEFVKPLKNTHMVLRRGLVLDKFGVGIELSPELKGDLGTLSVNKGTPMILKKPFDFTRLVYNHKLFKVEETKQKEETFVLWGRFLRNKTMTCLPLKAPTTLHPLDGSGYLLGNSKKVFGFAPNEQVTIIKNGERVVDLAKNLAYQLGFYKGDDDFIRRLNPVTGWTLIHEGLDYPIEFEVNTMNSYFYFSSEAKTLTKLKLNRSSTHKEFVYGYISTKNH